MDTKEAITDDRPLTDDEFTELLAYLDRHDWPLARDLRMMRANGGIAKAWGFVRMTYSEMRRRQAATR
jgi:hypothetical protein